MNDGAAGRAIHGYVLPEISTGRFHAIRDLFDAAGSLSGAAPDEGPAAGTWTATNVTKAGGTAGAAAAGTNASAHIDSGFADGFLSATFRSSGTPLTDMFSNLCFRMAGTGFDASMLPTQGWAVRVDYGAAGALNLTLFLNGVSQATNVAGLTFAATGVQDVTVEVRLNGAAIQVWCNGAQILNVSNATHQTATRVGLTRQTNATLTTIVQWEDFFFASVPTAPFGVAGRSGNGGNYTSAQLGLSAGVAPGARLPLHYRWGRLLAPGSPTNTASSVVLRDDAETLIGAGVVLSGTAGTQNGYRGPTDINQWATNTGTSGGVARHGLVRMEIFQESTGNTPANANWAIDSENRSTVTPSVPVGQTLDFGRGYTLVQVGVTSVQVPASLVAYAEVAAQGITLAAQPWRASAVPTIQPRQGGADVSGKGGAGSAWSSGVSSRNDTMDKQFARANTGVQQRFTMPVQASLNSESVIGFSGSPPAGFQFATQAPLFTGFSVVETAGDTAWQADPRLTLTHLKQSNDNAYGTPPLIKDDKPNRLVTDLAFVAARVRNANGVGQNSITWQRYLRDSGLLVADVINDSVITTTRGGEAGWDPTLAPWSAALPGGAWVHRRTITSPSSATGSDMLLNNDYNFVLLAPDPSLRVIIGAAPVGDAAIKDHWHPGDPMLIGLALFNGTSGVVVPIDAGTASVFIGRFNQTLGRAEYYDVDETWKHLTTTQAYAWPLADSAGDANVKVLTFSDTSAFDNSTLRFVGYCERNGTPYSGPSIELAMGTANGHRVNAFDGADFAAGFPFK